MNLYRCPFCGSTVLNIGYSFSIRGKMRYVSCKCGAQLNVEERRRTEVYIHNLNEDGFTPVLVKATPQEVK